MRIHIQVFFQRETSQIINWIDMDSLTVKPKQNTSGGTSSPLVSHLWKQHLSNKSRLGVQELNNFWPKATQGQIINKGSEWTHLSFTATVTKHNYNKLFRPQFSLHLATTLTRHHLPNKKNQTKVIYTSDSSHHFHPFPSFHKPTKWLHCCLRFVEA